jgi:hypothetical protein
MENNTKFLDFIKSINPWWERKSFRFKVITRKDYLNNVVERGDKLIDIFIGARRVGKTSIMETIINHLLKKDIDPKNIIFISAEIREVKEKGIKEIIDVVTKENKKDYFKETLHIFIDEVQEIDEWQNDIKLLYDNSKIKFYLSGSSSLILNSKTSKLTGRYFLQKVLPLSFSEFLKFTKQSIGNVQKKNQSILNSYIDLGGYPEYVLNRNQSYLRQSIESTLYRDLLAVYGIRNPKILEALLEFLADKITTPVSANRIKNDLKIDDKTAKFYLQYLQDVYLIYPVYRIGPSNKISLTSPPKYYLNDTGVLNILGIQPRIGHLVENMIFLKFLQAQNKVEFPKIYYNVIETHEIDFYFNKKNYEVKGYNEINDYNFEKYSLNDTEITIILPDENLNKDLYYSPNILYQGIIKFLLGTI